MGVAGQILKMEVNTVEFVSSALEQLSSLSTKICKGKDRTQHTN